MYSVIWAAGGWDHALGEPRDGGRCLGECASIWEAARLARRWAESCPWPGGAAVIDCAIGRAEALHVAAALRRMDPPPYVALVLNEDEADEAGLLAVADRVCQRSEAAAGAACAGLLGAVGEVA